MPVTAQFTAPAVSPAVALELVKAAAETAAAQVLLAASQPLVPKDTGKLVGSGRVEHDGLGAAVIYDAVAEDGYAYGIRQHEDLALNHPNGGQAKFLEQPMNTEHDAIMGAAHAIIAAAL